MRNILMTLCYIGTAYHGSQVQSNALSVTEVVQDAMETVLHCREDVKGCSRTDAGVHANRFCMNFHTDIRSLCMRLNAVSMRFCRTILGCWTAGRCRWISMPGTVAWANGIGI